MGRHEQKLWLILDEAEKKLKRAKMNSSLAYEWHKDICEALEKITIAKEKVSKELDI